MKWQYDTQLSCVVREKKIKLGGLKTQLKDPEVLSIITMWPNITKFDDVILYETN